MRFIINNINKFIEHYLPSAINRYLALDPESEQRLAALDGKIITLELAKKSIQIQFTSLGILLKTNQFSEPHAVIKSTPLSFLQMGLIKENRKKLFSENTIAIEGDLELGQQVIELFDALEIDWEDYFSRLLGDIPAHQFIRFTKKIRLFGKNIRTTLAENINEYIHEEALLFPSNEALQDFYQDVDNLRMDTDRLKEKIQQLAAKIAEKIDKKINKKRDKK